MYFMLNAIFVRTVKGFNELVYNTFSVHFFYLSRTFHAILYHFSFPFDDVFYTYDDLFFQINFSFYTDLTKRLHNMYVKYYFY